MILVFSVELIIEYIIILIDDIFGRKIMLSVIIKVVLFVIFIIEGDVR